MSSKGFSNELAKLLIHNKYLLDDFDKLKIVLEIKVRDFLEKYEEERIDFKDISHLSLQIEKGKN